MLTIYYAPFTQKTISEGSAINWKSSNRSGLIDCFNKEEFDTEYERLCNIWKTMPKRLEFIQYIDKYIKQYMKTNMLASVRKMWPWITTN